MKVVDMFGCELPVLSVDYRCISELVADGQTGLLFSDAPQLAHKLFSLLRGFPSEREKLDAMRLQVAAVHGVRWDAAWGQTAAPLFNSLAPPEPS